MKKWILAVFLLPLGAFGQYFPISQPHVTFLDASGLPCSLCTLATYAAGTTTPQATYQAQGGSANQNPIVLDIAGGANIWFGANAYKLVLVSALGATIWTVDNVPGNQLSGLCSTTGCTFTGPITGTSATFTGTMAAANVTGNVNGIYSVTTYGAKGDCTGSGATGACTDNHTAIQAAIDAAYATRGAVYFPSSTAASGQTVYYTSAAINPKGVSMYGPQGASGPPNSVTSTLPVAVRGGVGKDVFDMPDPTTGGWVAPRNSFTVRDLAILVDDSTNASASFSHRKPGRPCNDVVATGSTVISSAAQCMFQPGDAGQAIVVNGTTTTIASVQSATQATLAASISSGSALATYISVAGLSATQTIGNCGFAYDAKDFTAAFGSSPIKSAFDDVLINTIDNAQSNFTCGYFFQGLFGPYQTRWNHGYVGGQFGFVFVPADSVAPSSSQPTGLQDFNTWSQIWIGATYPWISYDGDFNAIRDMQVNFTHQGVQILSSYGLDISTGFTPSSWYIDIPEIESPSSTCNSTDVAFRMSGGINRIGRLAIPFCGSNSQAIQWDASQSIADQIVPVSLGSLNVTGSQNKLVLSVRPHNSSFALTNTGLGNDIRTGPGSPANNNFGSVAPPRSARYAIDSTGVTDPNSSRSATTFERTHDFLSKGVYYYNDEDLWIWPSEISLDTGVTPIVVTDANSITGQALQITGTSGYGGSSVIDGTYFKTGVQVPFGKVRAYIMARSTGSTVTGWGWSLDWGGNVYCSLSSLSVTSTYTLYSCDADMTGFTVGSNVGFLFNAPGAGSTINIAWMGIQPYMSAPYSALQIGTTGTPMTAEHGAGTSAQTSDGTGTSGHPAIYGAGGVLTDGPAGYTGTVTCGAGTHVNVLVVANGIITTAPTCN